MRKGLVLFQFLVVTSLLIGILTLNKQLDYMANKDMGYDPKNLVYVRSSDKMRNDNNNYQAFADEVANHSGIQHIAGVANGSYQTVQYEGMPVTERKGAIIMVAGPEYAEAMAVPAARVSPLTFLPLLSLPSQLYRISLDFSGFFAVAILLP